MSKGEHFYKLNLLLGDLAC